MSNNQVARKFYRDYKKLHKKLDKNIIGINDEEEKSWYSSVILNRLMITYFLEKKSLLNSNRNYLKEKYQEYNSNFYENFLLYLFHEGFDIPINDRKKSQINFFGDIPYINGNIFGQHYIEKKYKDIKIKNIVFKDVLKTFEKYNWALNNIKSRDMTISPKILGYIFEKYINQKEKGAYYTKSDTTEYISKYTIITNIMTQLKKQIPNLLSENYFAYKILKSNPQKYLYNFENTIKIPDNIIQGKDEVFKRYQWNKYIDESEIKEGLTWREYIDEFENRKQIIETIKNNEIKSVNDLITNNIDILNFFKDVIKNADPKFIEELFYILVGNDNNLPISILDPTCGSGAFLISALEILETIYESCINRMNELVESKKVNESSNFQNILNEIKMHKNQQYYIYKKIIKDNLYGVDIMDEAIEISKIRLMLRLISLVDNYNEIEPLPDLENNIVSGNSLVGFYDITDLNNSYNLNKSKNYHIEKIDKKELDKLYLSDKFNEIENIKKWETTAKPFHWIEKFKKIIINNNGFDCIIGNPPYVEYYTIKDDYKVKEFETIKCNNLSAFVTERSINLLNDQGNIGFIIPISIVSTPRMSDLRNLIDNSFSYTYYSNFADRPGTLFEGVHQKLTIMLGQKNSKNKNTKTYTSKYYHWYSNNNQNEREHLFDNIKYVKNPINKYRDDTIIKLGNSIDLNIWNKIQDKSKSIYDYFGNETKNTIYLSKRMTFWTKCFLNPKKSNEFKEYFLQSDLKAKVIMAIFNSNLYFYFWELVSDCWHITNKELKLFKIDLDDMDHSFKLELANLATKLEKDLEKNKVEVNTVQTDFEYRHRKSKEIIDKIDIILAKHYKLTKKEIDYIINYNIKYRMSGKFSYEKRDYKKTYKLLERGF
jgi:hypothetical protein